MGTIVFIFSMIALLWYFFCWGQELNFYQAQTFCFNKGGRLCTKTEVESKCVSSNENSCDFDTQLLWTKTSPSGDDENYVSCNSTILLIL